MTILPPRGTKRLCHGDTHVYLVGQPYCTCGGQIAVWGTCPICDQPESQHIVYPNGDTQCPPMAATSPAAKPEAEDVPLSRLRAARDDAKATHLSADGLRAYRDDRGNPEVCSWDEGAGAIRFVVGLWPGGE